MKRMVAAGVFTLILFFAVVAVISAALPVGGLSNLDSKPLTIDLLCKIWADREILAYEQEPAISVAVFHQNMEPIRNVYGVATITYPNGETQNYAIPPTGDDGISTFSLQLLDYADTADPGDQIVIDVDLNTYDMGCSVSLTLLLWY